MEAGDFNPGVQFCVRRPDRFLFTPTHGTILKLRTTDAADTVVRPDGSKGSGRSVPTKLR